MIKGIKWYSLRLSFSDFARGPEESLESHVLGLVKKFKLVAATVLKESSHYSMFGVPASTQLFGSHPGTRPVFIEIFISEVKLDSFITELEELALKGKSNVFYSKHEMSSIIGDPSVLDKIDEYKEQG
ncbi:MAG: hypothetical protein KAI29_08660 [Cyclobacteriaceae bacterium]|nr:hypothetical protein [Cyclobacteriaceae bacterium]